MTDVLDELQQIKNMDEGLHDMDLAMIAGRAFDEIQRLRKCITEMPTVDLEFETEDDMARWDEWKFNFTDLLNPSS